MKRTNLQSLLREDAQAAALAEAERLALELQIAIDRCHELGMPVFFGPSFEEDPGPRGRYARVRLAIAHELRADEELTRRKREAEEAIRDSIEDRARAFLNTIPTELAVELQDTKLAGDLISPLSDILEHLEEGEDESAD